ncbi:MAG TPA: hypothetical protein GX505_04725 [Clostridiales bacterium]|nr:hypothetical protein [Clostridiales bacterium]
MGKIYLHLDEGIPQFVCTECSNCRSLLGISLCTVQNRGCCAYFPKFELYDIHKMSKTHEGLKLLDMIRKLPGTEVYNYYIHAKGQFDEKGYSKFMQSVRASEFELDDKTVFFRTCPFVKPGKGCTLPVKYRHYICNVFICSEVIERASDLELYQVYTDACSSYARWIKWENDSLEMLLREKGITLNENFEEVVELLKDIPLDQYEFPPLPEIQIESGFSIGA